MIYVFPGIPVKNCILRICSVMTQLCMLLLHSEGTSYGVLAEHTTGELSHCIYPEFMGFMVLLFSVVYLIWNSCLVAGARER